MFNFSGDIVIGDDVLPEGVIALPTNKQAQNIILDSGAMLAGIRFYPAIGYGVFGRRYEKPTLLEAKNDQQYNFYELYACLSALKDNEKQIEVLHCWAEKHLDLVHLIPDSLEKALEFIEQDIALGELNDINVLSQRQIERLFKQWLGMTPKYYQRILRIKKAICYLRQHRDANLANVAQLFGFSDQAHMTREFRCIACITPGQL